MADDDRHPGGRPTKYRDKFPVQAEKLCKLGATDAEMADFFGVDERTIYRWKDEHDEFCQALTRGKILADAEIADSLFHRAKGYSHSAIKFHVVNGTVVETPYTEHYPPDTPAATLWLKNRQPAKWRDRQDVNLSGEVSLGGGIAGLLKAYKGGADQG